MLSEQNHGEFYTVSNDRFDPVGSERYSRSDLFALADGSPLRFSCDGSVSVEGSHGWEPFAEEIQAYTIADVYVSFESKDDERDYASMPSEALYGDYTASEFKDIEGVIAALNKDKPDGVRLYSKNAL
jgi:hypothetical protein